MLPGRSADDAATLSSGFLENGKLRLRWLKGGSASIAAIPRERVNHPACSG